MTLENRTRSYRGLVFGGPSSPYRILEEDGLEGFEVRDGDRPIPREDGSVPGLHRVESKVVVLRLRVEGSDAADLESKLADLEAATVPSPEDEFEYRFMNSGRAERFVRARVLRRGRPRTAELEGAATAEVPIMFKVADPRIYSAAESTIVVPIYTASGGGFNLPANLPWNMTASTGTYGTATNDGAREAFPVVRFQYPSGGSGTCLGVRLENLTNGDVLDIDAEITSGQILTADMDALIRATGDSVVRIGSASRYGLWQLPREPFRLSSGDNLLKFEVDDGTSTDIVCSVSWRDTD